MRVRTIAVIAILLFVSAGRAAEIGPLPHRALDLLEERQGEAQPPPSSDSGESPSPPGSPEAPPPGGSAADTSPGTTAPGPAVSAPALPAGGAGEKGVPAESPQEAQKGGVAPIAEEPVAGKAMEGAPAAPQAVPPPSMPSPQPPALSGAPGFLVKFNNADLYEVIHTLGPMAGINYLIDPRVRGLVNVHTQGTVRKEGALDLLFSILRINGATAVREGNLYHIVPMAEAKMEPLLLAMESRTEDRSSPNRPVMRAFALQHIAATEMAKVLKPFLSTGGDATEVPRANMVLVTDTAANMEKLARIVNLFDADAFRSAGVKLFPLKFLDPEEMGQSLETIFGALDFGTEGGKPAGIHFVPLPRMNALLVVSASPKSMEDIERWIGELDREPSGTSRAVHLYRVRHGKADDIMAILEKLYPGKTVSQPGKATEFKAKVNEPGQKSFPSNPKTPAPRVESNVPALQEGTFDIILDEPLNALIIRGSASEYKAVLETLQTIDVYPRQVLLEVLIAEVQLDDGLKMGIDWTYVNKGSDWKQVASVATPAADITSGFKYVVDKTDRLTAALRALANDGKVSILSSPSVISTNGKKSKIDVADQVPIVTGTVTNPGPDAFVTETVEYRDVGILLTYTPYINDEGIVTLEIEQEVSDVKATTVGSSGNPSFFKRSVTTNLVATQDRSIVLGGLVREKRERAREGIPFLYKIPIIGWIFGYESNTVARTELLFFITPRVIGSIEEGTRLSQEFENRVEELKARIGEVKGIAAGKEEPPRE
jgi:general secretion pathway protein D